MHCVKCVKIRSLFWSVFSCIQTEHGDLQNIQSDYKKIGTRKNSVSGKFSHSAEKPENQRLSHVFRVMKWKNWREMR